MTGTGFLGSGKTFLGQQNFLGVEKEVVRGWENFLGEADSKIFLGEAGVGRGRGQQK